MDINEKRLQKISKLEKKIREREKLIGQVEHQMELDQKVVDVMDEGDTKERYKKKVVKAKSEISFMESENTNDQFSIEDLKTAIKWEGKKIPGVTWHKSLSYKEKIDSAIARAEDTYDTERSEDDVDFLKKRLAQYEKSAQTWKEARDNAQYTFDAAKKELDLCNKRIKEVYGIIESYKNQIRAAAGK
jgi:hypothetical protein